MKRYKKVPIILEELDVLMPAREECKLMTELELRNISQESSFKVLALNLKEIKFKKKEIPNNELWFKLLLVIILSTVWVNHENVGISDESVFNLNDSETRKKVMNIKNSINQADDIYQMPLYNFLCWVTHCSRGI